MEVLKNIWRRLRGSSSGPADLDDELRFHLDMEAERNLACGLEAQAARRAAGRDFGGIEKYKEECRDVRPSTWLLSVVQDVRFGARILARSPGFTLLAILSLATGIGATTAIFTVLDALLLRPLPYKDADRIVRIAEFPEQRPDHWQGVMIRNFLKYKEQSKAFEHMAAIAMNHPRNLNADDNPELLAGQLFTDGFLKVFGVQPAVGRSFVREEYEKPRRDYPVIISDSFWARRFNRDPGAIGTTLPFEGLQQQVIGVMPPDFQPVGEPSVDFWGPRIFSRANLEATYRWQPVFAKLKPGVTIEQAQADMDRIAEGLAREDAANAGWKVKVLPLQESMFGWTRRLWLPIVGSVVLVLMIACVNVAALLLGRTAKRQREIAVRLSIGAGRSRIVRQLLTESLLLGLAGGLAGLAVAHWALRAIVGLAPEGLPLAKTSIDGRVLAFAFGVSVLTGVLFGLAPAFAGIRSTGSGLQHGPRYFGGGPARQRFRRILVTGEIALALVLLAGAGLLINSFLRLSGVDPGFNTRNILTYQVKYSPVGTLNPGPVRTGESLLRISSEHAQRFEQVLTELRSVPGVRAAAMAGHPPMNGWRTPRATLKIQGQAHQQDRPIEYLVVSNGFFETLGIPVLRGRDFSHADVQEAEWVAVLNESAARRYWPDSDPLGQHLTLDVQGTSQNRRVIGVVRDFRYGRLNEPAGPAVYVSHLQQPLIFRSTSWIPQVSRTFLFRLAVPPEHVLTGMRTTVARLTGNQPIFQVHTVEEMQGELFRAPRFTLTLLGAFAAFGLILAAAGTFGVTSYSVIQRSREIGLRMALGAHRADVVRMILSEGLLIGGIGIGLGMAGAAGATQVLKAHLFEIEPADPTTLALVALLMLLVIVSACYVPVLRASRVQPVEVLRHE